jgi:hypothetical protein
MVENEIIQIEASRLTAQFYNDTLLMTPGHHPDFSFFGAPAAFITQFSKTFSEFIRSLANAPTHEESYVQMACRPLWEKINQIFFKDYQCIVDNGKRHITTYFDDVFDNDFKGLRRCRVTGIPDGSIMWNSQSVHVWELKNQTYQLDGTSCFSHCACAQIAVYMKADIESMWARHSYIPAISTGLLTNGSYWILVTAYSTLVLGNSINIH